MSQQEINYFYQNCVRTNTWTGECSALLQANADQLWLQQAVAEIFIAEVPQRNLANPVVNKLVAMTPDCLISPQACQGGLNWACLNSSAEVNSKYGYNRGAASRLCGCFSSTTKDKAWQTNCYCNSAAGLAVTNLSQPLCLANICAIDNVMVTLNNSSTAGNINLQQACGGYNLQARVACDIDGVNIYVDNSSIGSVLLQQQCLTNTATPPTLDGTVTIDEQLQTPGIGTDVVAESQPWLITTLVLILVIFIVLLTVTLLLYVKSIPQYRLTIVDSSSSTTTATVTATKS